MLYEQQLLSKVLEEKNFWILNKYNVRKEDFHTVTEVYEFIKEYVMEYNETPDFRTVVGKFENFDFQPKVHDTFPYLCKVLKSASAKRKAYELLQKQAGEKFNNLNGTDFINWLADESARIKEVSSGSSSSGTNFAVNGTERLQWYMDSKENRSNIFVPTPYETLTKYLAGGFELGDYVLLMAYTNRRKSWIGSQIGVTAWNHNFGVMHYSPELSKVQQINRLDTLNGHFNNVGLRNGQLYDEKEFKVYLKQFSSKNETPYIVKTMEDLNKGLSTEVVEADLQANPDIKFVIIDGFNLMNHKGKQGNRNNMSNTSRKLRQIFGKYGVVGLVIHQTPTSAEKENRKEDETGARIIEPPRIDQYSETVAVIQDACTVVTFDAHDGMGAIKLAKCRQPNVDKIVNLQCNFNEGYITEPKVTFEF